MECPSGISGAYWKGPGLLHMIQALASDTGTLPCVATVHFTNFLDILGNYKAQYELRKVLPEGFYSVCITAYDYSNPNNIKVSNESCAYGMMILSDPPYLNIPGCGASLSVTNPQQITFNWTPINQVSPNSALQTDYVLELFEVYRLFVNQIRIIFRVFLLISIYYQKNIYF